MIRQIDKKKFTVAPFSNFYGQIWVGFCFNTEKGFALEVLFRSQQKEHKFVQKGVLGAFKIALRSRDRHVFVWQSLQTLHFQCFKTKTFFKKLEYCFLVESTNIENATIPYKSLSVANVKTNWIESTK